MERRFQKAKKLLNDTTHFLPYPKISSGHKNEQNWVFIKYGHVIYRWKALGKKILKRPKNFGSS